MPAQVITVVRAARPQLDFQKAEGVEHNGVFYYDIEGEDADGNETGLDMIKTKEGWVAVEIQRDIPVSATPRDETGEAKYEVKLDESGAQYLEEE